MRQDNWPRGIRSQPTGKRDRAPSWSSKVILPKAPTDLGQSLGAVPFPLGRALAKNHWNSRG